MSVLEEGRRVLRSCGEQVVLALLKQGLILETYEWTQEHLPNRRYKRTQG